MARKTKNAPHLRLRVEPGLLARLEKSAAKNERTLTGEIVHRLEHSYETARQIEDVFGGRDVYGLMRVIAASMYETGRSAAYDLTVSAEGAKNWPEIPWAYDQAVRAASRVFEAFRPIGDPSPPAGSEHIQNLGRGFASGILNEIARGEARVSTNAGRTEELRRELGPLAERLTEAETMKEDLKFNIQRDDNQQMTVTLTNKKPSGTESTEKQGKRK